MRFPFRLDQANLEKVYPGCLTEIMAVPWQADFRTAPAVSGGRRNGRTSP